MKQHHHLARNQCGIYEKQEKQKERKIDRSKSKTFNQSEKDEQPRGKKSGMFSPMRRPGQNTGFFSNQTSLQLNDYSLRCKRQIAYEDVSPLKSTDTRASHKTSLLRKPSLSPVKVNNIITGEHPSCFQSTSQAMSQRVLQKSSEKGPARGTLRLGS